MKHQAGWRRHLPGGEVLVPRVPHWEAGVGRAGVPHWEVGAGRVGLAG